MATENDWWSYPQKPSPIGRVALKGLNLADYSMEFKFDGWRVIIINNGSLQFFTREKKPIKVPPALVKLVKDLDLPLGTVLDGEIWNPEKRAAWSNIDIWDVIRHGTKTLSMSPIEERRRSLEQLLPEKGDVKRIQVLNPSLEAIDTIETFAWRNRNAKRLESGFIHGVVLKKNRSIRHDSANRSQKHGDWLKYVFKGMTGYEPRI
jgi:ATP-dependent DNA ligase